MMKFELQGPKSQEKQRQSLISALEESRFPQALLIEGAPGVGKKKLAFDLARILSCSHETHRPCGHCFGCKMILDSGAVSNWVIPLESKEAGAKRASEVSAGSTAKTVDDYVAHYAKEILENPYRLNYITPAAFISVDLIRTMTSRFGLKGDRVRCVMIAEAERMNEAASNALLKTLEEVPPETYFILTTSYKERLLSTILSRCITLHLPSMTDDEVKQTVREISGEALNPDILGMAFGSPGKAIYYGSYRESLVTLAADFLRHAFQKEFSELFFALESENLKEIEDALFLLDVISFLLNDAVRYLSGEPLRARELSESLALWDLLPDGETLNAALLQTQETIARIESRKSAPMVALQVFAIKVFEGVLRK